MKTSKHGAHLVLLAVWLGFATSARAQATTSSVAPSTTRTSSVTSASTATSTTSGAAPALLTEKRAKPNLDGRAPAGPDAGEVMLWVPKVLLSPVHLVMEWGLRRPLGWVLTVAEQDRWADLIIDFFTFEERKVGIVPTFFLDFNFRPSVGLYLFANELFVKPHSVRLTAGWGGEDWYRLTFVDRWALGRRGQLDFAFSLWARPDYIYTGEGLDANPDDRSRFFQEFIDGSALLLLRPWRRTELRLEGGLRQNRFRDGDADADELTLSEGVNQGRFAEPVAFQDGYVAAFQRVLLKVDTRLPRPENQSGMTIGGYANHGWDIENPSTRHWLGFGGNLAGHLDIGQFRTLSVSAQAHVVNPFEDGDEIPFTELFVLGRRPDDLSGFLPGILRGRSAAVLTIGYTYPVWIFMDAEFQASVGNVYGRNFEDFSFDAARGSLGLGLKSTQDPDNAFTMLFAFGTSRFDEPFAIDTFRLVFGTQTGF